MQCQKLKTYMETGRVVFLPVRSIRPNPSQPRKVFQPEPLQELADSIARHGILQPLSVRRIPGGYELIAGERRLRAAQIAGLSEVPCIVMQMDARESGMAAMVENLQRQGLDFIEEALGIRHLLEEYQMSQEQAARLLGKERRLEDRYGLCYAVCAAAALCTTAVNTLVMYLDSVIMGYYSFAYVFGSALIRICSGILTAVVVSTVAIPLVRLLRRQKLVQA